MIQRKAYRFRLEPNGSQRRQMARAAGSARWAWNQALAEQKRRLDAGEPLASYAEMCRWLTGWRYDPATAWLEDVHSQPLQQRLKDLARALADAFLPEEHPAKKDFPKFRKKHKDHSFRYPQSVKAEVRSDGWGCVWLPKIGWVPYRASRPIEGEICQATISLEGGHWFVSIQTEREIADPTPDETSPVGIDLGVARFVTLSDGTVFEPLNAFKHIRRRVARAQRKLARKQKCSANWKKQKRRIAKLRRQERNVRMDYLHKTSTTIAKNHGLVVMEELPIKNMSRSAKGTIEAPGKNVKAKAGLNRSILDQGWGCFRGMLATKLAMRGGRLILVPPPYTSQMCSTCGHVDGDNRPTQARFCCVGCGFSEHADLNAARNILKAAGHAVSACGGIGRQPPVEAGTQGEAA